MKNNMGGQPREGLRSWEPDGRDTEVFYSADAVIMAKGATAHPRVACTELVFNIREQISLADLDRVFTEAGLSADADAGRVSWSVDRENLKKGYVQYRVRFEKGDFPAIDRSLRIAIKKAMHYSDGPVIMKTILADGRATGETIMPKVSPSRYEGATLVESPPPPPEVDIEEVALKKFRISL